MTYLIDQKQPPCAARVETWGYGGIGMAFLEVKNDSYCCIPSKVVRIKGNVKDARNILIDDTRWTFLGEPDSTKTFLNPDISGRRHVIEIQLGPVAD